MVWFNFIRYSLSLFALLVLPCTQPALGVIAALLILLLNNFLYDVVFARSYRHLMYSLMNKTGFSFWMGKSYRVINKISEFLCLK